MKIAILGNMDVEGEEGVEVKHYDINSFYPNKKIDGEFDRIFVSNSLPELGRDEVMRFLDRARDALAEGGKLSIQVPMAEYAAKQLFTNKADQITYFMLYGTDDHPFKACYTMMQIRSLLARAGYNVTEASEAILKLKTIEGEVIDLPVHSVTAVRND